MPARSISVPMMADMLKEPNRASVEVKAKLNDLIEQLRGLDKTIF